MNLKLRVVCMSTTTAYARAMCNHMEKDIQSSGIPRGVVTIEPMVIQKDHPRGELIYCGQSTGASHYRPLRNELYKHNQVHTSRMGLLRDLAELIKAHEEKTGTIAHTTEEEIPMALTGKLEVTVRWFDRHGNSHTVANMTDDQLLDAVIWITERKAQLGAVESKRVAKELLELTAAHDALVAEYDSRGDA